MSWKEQHGRSAQLAAEAEVAARRGDVGKASELYALAAAAEKYALDEVAPAQDRQRTRDITAVSWVALTMKSGDLDAAERAAWCLLSAAVEVGPSARSQLVEMLRDVQRQRRWFSKIEPSSGERVAYLVEECGEVGKVIGKVLRHGWESAHPDNPTGPNNRQSLEIELGDVLFAVRLLAAGGDIRLDVVRAFADKKWENPPEKWFHHQDWNALRSSGVAAEPGEAREVGE